MNIDPENFLRTCFNVFVESADPKKILPQYLPENKTNPAIVIGAGKAAARMAASFEENWLGDLRGAAVVPYGHTENCSQIEIIEASHPTPDEGSIIAARKITKLIKNLNTEDNIYILLSGGGSSLLCLPPDGVTLTEKQSVSKSLLNSGATIDEINCVRKHLSVVKGGRLAEMAAPATLHTYAISDVVGDDPAVIASGPTVADPTTCGDAMRMLEKYSIDCPTSIWEWLDSPASETVKKIDPKNNYQIIASANTALKKLGEFCLSQNVHFINMGELSGDAETLGKEHALIAKQIRNDAPTLVYSGGETTVNVKGDGRGGRNSEYLLSLAVALDGAKNIYALAGDTDGIDGSEDNAGAIITPDTLDRLNQLELDAPKLLSNNDSYTAFEALGDLVITGPTKTNINDLRAILVLPQ